VERVDITGHCFALCDGRVVVIGVVNSDQILRHDFSWNGLGGTRPATAGRRARELGTTAFHRGSVKTPNCNGHRESIFSVARELRANLDSLQLNT
jgi:hypothetical protein